METCQQYRVVITGTPGVGKHSTATFLNKKLVGSTIIDINKVAFGHDVFLNINGQRTDEVNLKKLSNLIETELLLHDRCIIIGHLAPYVVNPKKITLAAVLRRSPYHLSSTLEHRGYSISKVNDNVVSEILDVSFFDTLKVFGAAKTTEIDTSNITLVEVADIIESTLFRKCDRKIGTTDWISLICRNGDSNKFLRL
ncbi:MAG TPA: AAA family ATPase [Nitrososphaeraceae archaeon]